MEEKIEAVAAASGFQRAVSRNSAIAPGRLEKRPGSPVLLPQQREGERGQHACQCGKIIDNSFLERRNDVRDSI